MVRAKTVSKYTASTAMLLAGSMLAGVPLSGEALAQTASAPAPAPTTTAPEPPQAAAPATPPQVRTIRSLRVEGSLRIEPETVLSYTKLRVGEPYTSETVDQAIKDLYASDLLADVSIEGVETGDLIIRTRENPIINRVVLEGNKRLKNDKILPEIKLAPRQIFTRSGVRSDVARIIELYRRQGRFAASVEPQMVSLDQNRVDVIFEINEGPKSKVRQINILGNEKYDDDTLRGEMATKQSRWFRLFSSNTSYDQDRLAYDQQKLRQFYLTEGYADFRVISAVAELTPDKEDFIITYVVEEGPRYKFGEVTVDSAIRDFDDEALAKTLPIKQGDWYNAKLVEDSLDQLSEYAGLFGYAYADVRPEYKRDREALTMTLSFQLAEANRTYVERIDITGNTLTQDKVIRREMRVAEGDAFNTFLVKRSQDRINSLGYFQDKFEIERKEGSAPDRVVLAANVEERSTGELSLSAGFSSLERFILQGAIRQRNFRGRGQDLRAEVSYSSFQKSAEVGFTEPFLFDKPILLGGTIFRRDFNSFNFINNDRNTTFSQVSTGFSIVSGVPLTEFWQLSGRYTLQQDDVTLDEDLFFTNGVCDPLRAGRFLCDQIGNRLTSSITLALIFSNLNSRLRPTRGQQLSLSGDFAGLGGDVRYLRGRVDFDKYWSFGRGWVLSVGAEGGYIKSLQDSPGEGIDPVRIIDRFYLGEPQFRGFQIRGVGPRVQRLFFSGIDPQTGVQELLTGRRDRTDDPLGGRAYYLGKIELEPPLGASVAELGLRPSVFVQVGALFGVTRPILQAPQATDPNGAPLFIGRNADGTFSATTAATDAAGNANAPQLQFIERFLGDSPRPRVSVGVGVNWNSPFGPLRLDLAKDILSVEGDDPKLFTFNVGTAF